jgi:hypothetical protein
VRGALASALDLDLPRRQRGPAQGLQGRLLGGEARRKVACRPPAGLGEAQLALGEEPLGELRPALERSLDAADLDQVEADGVTACHSTPTTSLAIVRSSSE